MYLGMLEVDVDEGKDEGKRLAVSDIYVGTGCGTSLAISFDLADGRRVFLDLTSLGLHKLDAAIKKVR